MVQVRMFSVSIWLGILVAYIFFTAERPALAADFQLAERDVLHTWWHSNAQWDEPAPLPRDRVRRSGSYHVRVGLVDEPGLAYDSFTYCSVPRSGMPAGAGLEADGAEFASQNGLSMSWSSFRYGRDVFVYVKRLQSTIPPAAGVVIRPTNLELKAEQVDAYTVRIKVPYRAAGQRFSVEFADDLFTSRLADDGSLGTRDGRSIHQEPRHALLIFANPTADGQMAETRPDPSAADVWSPPPGELDIQAMEGYRVVYFAPGTYALPPASHGYLPASIEWLYFAPGSYVRAAFEFRGERSAYKVTGEGVLSGEDYEYEADRRFGYKRTLASECHATCVKMLQFFSRDWPQSLLLQGVTLANPPYHSFVVYGDRQSFAIQADNFKQVGAWYWQTDGIELTEHSTMQHVFLHANDDALKLYQGDIKVEDVVVWKGENGPVIQFGWFPRSFANVHVKDLTVIHNRMFWPNFIHNHCLINSALDYRDPSSLHMADTSQTIRNLLLENIRSEGQNLCAMRLYALSNWENIRIKNLWIESWNQLSAIDQQSQLKRTAQPDGQQVRIGQGAETGLIIEQYRIGTERVSRDLNNWQAEQLGRLSFDAELWGSWDLR